MSDKKINISASRLKDYLLCSYYYYCNYVLKLPKKKTKHLSLGSTVHDILEQLVNPKREDFVTKIIKNNAFNKALNRYVDFLFKKHNWKEYDGPEQRAEIEGMVLAALNLDFYFKQGKVLTVEEQFNYENKELGYRLKGFIDLLGLVEDTAYIRDYKSSSRIDVGFNYQSMLYALYLMKTKGLKSFSEFWFLRFGEDGIQRVEYTDEELKGFEYFLSEIQHQLDNFTEKDAYKHFAADDGYPAKHEGFKKRLKCGYAKYKGHLKKDGVSLHYHCDFKFSYIYYVLIDQSGNQVDSAVEEELQKLLDKQKQQPELKLEQREYKGCPRFN